METTEKILENIQNTILDLDSSIPDIFPILWKFSKIIIFPKSNKPLDTPTSYRPSLVFPVKNFGKAYLKTLTTAYYY